MEGCGEVVVGLWGQRRRSEREVCERVVGLQHTLPERLSSFLFPLGAKSCRAAWHERTFLSAKLRHAHSASNVFIIIIDGYSLGGRRSLDFWQHVRSKAPSNKYRNVKTM